MNDIDLQTRAHTPLLPAGFIAPELPKVRWASGRSATKKFASPRARVQVKPALKGSGYAKAHPKPQPSRHAAARAEKRALANPAQ
jgi:hypothetical protein